MSTVLVGILGVIVFIGLALAVVQILGSDFWTAGTQTRAAAVQQILKQTADGANMASLKTGIVVNSQAVNASSPLIPRFIKTVPVNPVANNTIMLLDSTGNNGGTEARIAVMFLQGDENSRQICETISRSAGQTADSATFDASTKSFAFSSLNTAYGCQFNGTYYVAFQKL